MPTPSRPPDLARRLAGLACTNVLDVLRGLGYVRVYMEGVRTLAAGRKMAGRAVTVRFLPERPDLAARPKAMPMTPEYRAIERAGPGDVLVMAAMGLPFASVWGGIKFLRLKQRGAAGIVVVPGPLAEEVLARTRHKVEIEEFIKRRVVAENVSPSRYYPSTERIERLFAESRRKSRRRG